MKTIILSVMLALGTILFAIPEKQSVMIETIEAAGSFDNGTKNDFNLLCMPIPPIFWPIPPTNPGRSTMVSYV